MVRVACAQVALDIDDPAAGWSRALAAVREAADEGAEVVVLPELATCGMVFTSRDEAISAGEASVARIGELARLSAELGVVLVAGAAEPRPGGDVPDTDPPYQDAPYNTAVVLDRGRHLGTYRKVHLWGEECRWFAAGDQPPLVVDTSAGRIGVMICYDLEFAEWVRLARQQGAELICGPANWPYIESPPGERPLEVIKAQASAGAYRVPIAIADRVGPERDIDWIGGSVIIGSDGWLRTELRLGVPHLAVADVEVARSTSIGPYNDAFADRRPDLYAEHPGFVAQRPRPDTAAEAAPDSR